MLVTPLDCRDRRSSGRSREAPNARLRFRDSRRPGSFCRQARPARAAQIRWATGFSRRTVSNFSQYASPVVLEPAFERSLARADSTPPRRVHLLSQGEPPRRWLVRRLPAQSRSATKESSSTSTESSCHGDIPIQLVGAFFPPQTNRGSCWRASYHPDEDRISIDIASRGGWYDFRRVDNDDSSPFYARGKNPGPYIYRPPLATGDGWQVGTLEEAGIELEPIARLIEEEISPPA